MQPPPATEAVVMEMGMMEAGAAAEVREAAKKGMAGRAATERAEAGVLVMAAAAETAVPAEMVVAAAEKMAAMGQQLRC